MDSDKPYNPRIAMTCTGSALAERVKLRSRGSPQDLVQIRWKMVEQENDDIFKINFLSEKNGLKWNILLEEKMIEET